jgi:hypothetical protein
MKWEWEILLQPKEEPKKDGMKNVGKEIMNCD